MRRPAAAVIATVALLAVPAPALAVDRYVDEDAGVGGGTCTDPSDPCDQISDATAVSVSTDVILVGADLYSESVSLPVGVSLVADDFNPAFTSDNGGVTEIDGGAGNGILVVQGGAAHEIRGLRIEGDSDAIELQGGVGGHNVSIIGNTFPNRDTQFDSRIQVSDGAGAANVTIVGNAWTFGALTTTLGRIGIDDQTNGPLNAVVRNNNFDALSIPLRFTGSDPSIVGNTLTRVYEDDVAGLQSRAMTLADSSATVEGNSIAADSTSALGILVNNSGAAVDAPVLNRNSATGFDSNALDVRGAPATADTVTVTESLFTVTGSSFPLSAQDLGGLDSLSVRGVTLDKPSGSAFYLEDALLRLDSSILSGGISNFGMTSCTITFSRSSTTGTPGDLTDCNDFATTEPPGFVGGGDFSLADGSAMIDAGNPFAGSALDLAGNPRALLGTPTCTQTDGVRDIGAYEFVGPTGVGCPVLDPAPISNPNAVPPPAKKCKKPKKKKGKKAATAAKRKPKGCKKKKRKKKK